jgi:BMFP domain-containing protein YqiC
MNDIQEIKKIHDGMKQLKRWMQSQFQQIDWVLRLKKDIHFYMTEHEQLEIRVAKLENQSKS